MEQQEILQALFWGSMIFGAFKLGELWSVFKLERELTKLTEEDPETARRIDELATKIADTDLGERFRIERTQGQLLAYGDQQGFLAQGQDFRDVFSRMRDRYPGHRFHLVDYRAQFTEEECQRLVRDLKAVFEEPRQ